MSRITSSKIYIKCKEKVCDFMWLNVGPDDSIMLGFSQKGNESIQFILDENDKELRPKDLKIGKSLSNPKDTFHVSGHYKLSSFVGLNEENIDRCTVIGSPLNEITKPRRMMEVILPNKLQKTKNLISERDIILDSTGFSINSPKPLRCTISCMDEVNYEQLIEKNIPFCSTSECEFTRSLIYKNLIWTFTLRLSRLDTSLAEQFVSFVPGEIKWGQKTIS